MAQLPFMRQINRESHPNPVIRQLNPQRGNGISAGVTGLPKVGVKAMKHMAAGGEMGYDNSFDDTSDLSGAAQGYTGDAGIGAPVDSLGSNPDSYQDFAGNAAPQQMPQQVAPQAPQQAQGPHGLQGWMQGTHAGVKGSDWVKAGLTALTGILSGVANKKSTQYGQQIAGRANPQVAPTFAKIGVPLAFSQGGPVTPNALMTSPRQPAIRMAEGGAAPDISDGQNFSQAQSGGGMGSGIQDIVGDIGAIKGLFSKHASGGPVRLAGGGMPPTPAVMQQQPQQDPQAQQGGDTQQSQQLIAKAVQALLGQSQDPQADLQAFVQAFGPDALKALQQKVQQMSQGQGQGQQPQAGIGAQPQQQQTPPPGMANGGMLSGPGDGMSDSITANGGNVRVADGEYVLPADVVSSIGNGSSQAGSKRLDAAMSQLRQHKYGRPQQPPKLSASSNPIIKSLQK